MKKFYITTPLYYVNAEPHIGHSYTEIATDALSRFHRLLGEDVFFMTGTDEHGEKIEKAAISGGFKEHEEKKFVDTIVPKFKSLWKDLAIEYDYFIRTTDGYHEDAVRFVMDTLYKKGDIYKGEYAGWFCVPCEMFWSELQAPAGACPDCSRPLDRIKEDNYFFAISKYQDWLIGHIKKTPGFIRPEIRRNEVLSFLENNKLTDLCISRSKKRFQWGIELPFDKNYVTYVWFDALLNYISGCGYPKDKVKFIKYWPADLQMIGKDILRHHAVYWPIMLHSLGIEPPKTVFAHGWWIVRGEKMSKSKGNIVNPLDIIASYGVDSYRYFLLREIPFGQDGAFSEELLVNRINSDLANDLGNLVYRTLTMVEKYFGGVIPQASIKDCIFKDDVEALPETLKEKMAVLDFGGALEAIWGLINTANKYIETSKPWNLKKEGREDELKEFIYNLAEVLRIVCISILPFMPNTADSLAAQIGLENYLKSAGIKDIKWGLTRPGAKIRKAGPLFPRIE